MSFDRARRIADAVLYEGYVLYPYRASSSKNRVRWQWGVLAPRDWSEAGGAEAWWMETQCLLESLDAASVLGRIRFLHLEQRAIERASGDGFEAVETLEVDGKLWTSWDEAIERVVDFAVEVPAGSDAPQSEVPFAFAAAESVEPLVAESGAVVGRVVRRQAAISGAVCLSGRRLPGPYPLVRLHVRVENRSPWSDTGTAREETMRAAFIGTHTLLDAQQGAFLSLVDPPEWAKPAVADCKNTKTWPVLAGEKGDQSLVLSAPIILYDNPEIAPESPGDLYDATEIDEILSLRTMTLTEEEKREARSTDPRSAAILDRVDGMPPEILERLHGAIRSLKPVTPQGAPSANELAPWWDPGADASVSPESDAIEVSGISIARGSRVRLRPGQRRADAQDMFLDGKTATVEAVFFDVDEKSYLAVILDDDPAADIHQQHGRFLYFAPDEIEPLGEAR